MALAESRLSRASRTIRPTWRKPVALLAGTAALSAVLVGGAAGAAPASAAEAIVSRSGVVSVSAVREGAGVPDGVDLKVHNGDITVTRAGTVIDGLDVRGIIRIKAPDVTIKNTLVRGKALSSNNSMISNYGNNYNFTVINSELRASYPSPWINGILGSNFTVRNTQISRVIDPIHITGSNVTVERNWLHANLHYDRDPNHGNGPSHDDSIQVQAGNNIKIINNVMTDAHNAVLQVTQDAGDVSNLLFEGNAVDHGFCSVNISQKDRGPIYGLTFKDNRFGLNTEHPDCAVISPSTTKVSLVNNWFEDNGPLVTVTRGD